MKNIGTFERMVEALLKRINTPSGSGTVTDVSVAPKPALEVTLKVKSPFQFLKLVSKYIPYLPKQQ